MGTVVDNLHGPVDLRQVTVRYKLRWLVADTNLETSRTPIDELDGPLCLDAGNSSMDLLGHNIATVKQASGHVLAVTGVTLHHLVVRFEARV